MSEEEVTPEDINVVGQIRGSSHSGIRCPGCGREFTVAGMHHVLILDAEFDAEMDLP